MKTHSFVVKFVDNAPDDIQEGVIYISIEFATVIHKCCCGCGYEVITPLSPNQWMLTYDGVSISLYPSIGNWSYPCQSHYWIKRNRVVWAKKWSFSKIKAMRIENKRQEQSY